MTITKPHAVGWMVWATWLLPTSNQDREEDQDEDDADADADGFLAVKIEGELSPYLPELETELKDSPIPDSV